MTTTRDRLSPGQERENPSQSESPEDVPASVRLWSSPDDGRRPRSPSPIDAITVLGPDLKPLEDTGRVDGPFTSTGTPGRPWVRYCCMTCGARVRIWKRTGAIVRHGRPTCPDTGKVIPNAAWPPLTRATGKPAPLVAVFDLDGTLVEASPHDAHERNDVTVLRAAKPLLHVVRYAKRLIEDGWIVVVATSRNEAVREATVANLMQCGLWPIELYERGFDPFDLARGVTRKAEVIKAVGARLIVGDRDDLEGEAARAAGVAFRHVNEIPGGAS